MQEEVVVAAVVPQKDLVELHPDFQSGALQPLHYSLQANQPTEDP